MDVLIGPPFQMERVVLDVAAMGARAKWGSFARVDEVMEMVHTASASRPSGQLNHGSMLDLHIGDLSSAELFGARPAETSKSVSSEVKRGYSTVGRSSKKKRKNLATLHSEDFGTQELKVGYACRCKRRDGFR